MPPPEIGPGDVAIPMRKGLMGMFEPNMKIGNRNPHYTKIHVEEGARIETINPVTGKSIFYGIRPWHCMDRVEEWAASWYTKGSTWKDVSETWQLLKKCKASKLGEEPLDDYRFLDKKEVMFFVDRYKAGMIREEVFEPYPYNIREVQRVMHEDSTKMKVWRHQRILELDSKDGRLEDTISTSVGFTPTPKAYPRDIT